MERARDAFDIRHFWSNIFRFKRDVFDVRYITKYAAAVPLYEIYVYCVLVNLSAISKPTHCFPSLMTSAAVLQSVRTTRV